MINENAPSLGQIATEIVKEYAKQSLPINSKGGLTFNQFERVKGKVNLRVFIDWSVSNKRPLAGSLTETQYVKEYLSSKNLENPAQDIIPPLNEIETIVFKHWRKHLKVLI